MHHYWHFLISFIFGFNYFLGILFSFKVLDLPRGGISVQYCPSVHSKSLLARLLQLNMDLFNLCTRNSYILNGFSRHWHAYTWTSILIAYNVSTINLTQIYNYGTFWSIFNSASFWKVLWDCYWRSNILYMY
jgi:hypothetical protein